MTRLLTGHCHLKGHMFEVGLEDISERGRCKQASGTASRSLSDCETLAVLRLEYLDNHFMKPGALRRLRPHYSAGTLNA